MLLQECKSAAQNQSDRQSEQRNHPAFQSEAAPYCPVGGAESRKHPDVFSLLDVKHGKCAEDIEGNDADSKNDNQIDGELFIFGKSLQNLSGCARLEDGPLPFKLQYYIYDIVDTEKTFEERYKILQEIQKELNLGFDPEKTFGDDELMVQMLPQIKIPNDEKIMWKLHDQYVSEG